MPTSGARKVWDCNKKIASLMHMLIFEWYMTRTIVENGHQKGSCYNEMDYVLKVRTPF